MNDWGEVTIGQTCEWMDRWVEEREKERDRNHQKEERAEWLVRSQLPPASHVPPSGWVAAASQLTSATGDADGAGAGVPATFVLQQRVLGNTKQKFNSRAVRKKHTTNRSKSLSQHWNTGQFQVLILNCALAATTQKCLLSFSLFSLSPLQGQGNIDATRTHNYKVTVKHNEDNWRWPRGRLVQGNTSQAFGWVQLQLSGLLCCSFSPSYSVIHSLTQSLYPSASRIRERSWRVF